MRKSVKIILITTGILIVLTIGLFSLVTIVEKTLPSETIYPQSTLSNSIFESQNNIYVANEGLNENYSCTNVPYMIDVPNNRGALVGNGRFYSFGDDVFYLYVTEFDKQQDKSGMNTLKEEMSTAIMLDCNTDLTTLEEKSAGTGYINGFAANYFSGILNVSDGQLTNSVYMTGYELTVQETDEYGIIIAVISYAQSTQNLEVCKANLDIVTGTCRYDATLDEQIQERMAIETAEENTDENTDENTAQEIEEEIVTESANETAEELIVTIEEDYISLVVSFNYTNVNNTIDCILYSPDKLTSYRPVSIANGTAVFNVGAVSPGDYILSVQGDYGEGTVQLSNGNSPQENSVGAISNEDNNGEETTPGENEDNENEDTVNIDAE